MEYRFLGRTGVKVSSLCLGTMTFGGDSDEETSAAVYRRCREAGINFFDCADVYVGGRSEEILGNLVRGERDQVILATKAYFASGEDVNAAGSSRRHLMLSVEASLRRLGTDRIDLFYLHRFDATTPLDETLRALDDLVSQGKVLYLGASNFAAWQVAKGLGISSEQGWARFECIQPMYNLVKRQAEVELLPMAAAEEPGCVPLQPDGRWTAEREVRRRPASLTAAGWWRTRCTSLATGHRGSCRPRRILLPSPSSTVTIPPRWRWRGSGAIPPSRHPSSAPATSNSLNTTLGALEIELGEALRAEISALSPEPPPATDRNEERTTTNFGVRQ